MTLGLAFDDVLNAARANAPWAFQRLFADLAGPVTGYLRVQGAQEPDELANEVFLGVFSGINRFQGGEEQFRSWVFTIAHRRLTDERRRRGRRPPSTDVPVPDIGWGDVEDDALAAVGNGRVHQLLDRLVPDQREVMLLRILGDLTVAQTAQVLDKTPGAVKALQRRALTALRKEMAGEISEEGVPL